MFNNLKNRLDSESFVSLVLGIAVVLLLGSLIFNYFSGKKTANQEKAAQTEQPQAESQTPPTTHKVTDGETLWSISEQYYQSGYNWVDLASINKLSDAGHIEVGQNLTIPVVTPIVPKVEATVTGEISAASVTATPTPASYTVVHGDSLWSISLAHYGTGYRWPDIAKANNLANPGLIYAGNVFILP